MAETLTPNLLPNNKRRVSISARLQSPTSPFFLGSNDDKLERAQSRAARAAAVRRKPLDLLDDLPSESPSDASYLDSDQIMELFRNCIKLASENKINQKNTWELKLIDHLSEIIKVEAEDDTETNFQKASCTLEAGVKIYALRVDSVHSEAYKVLGGISRAGFEDHQETPIDGGNDGEEIGVNQSKKEQERKLSPSSTLESSYDALNVKKFDVAFAVDPLYHQTTAQFDEGGAKGLLLNNLGVYGGCRVLFDSQEVPAKCISSTNDDTSSNLIDISFAGEYIEQMVTNAKTKKEICPTFSTIVELLDECSLQLRRSHIGQDLSFDENAALDRIAGCKGSPEFKSVVDADNVEDAELDDDSYDHAAAWSCDNEESNIDDTVFNVDEHNMHNHLEEGDLFISDDRDMDDRFENGAPPLFGVTGIPSSQNAWAGPDFWKYRRSKGAETVTTRDNEMANTAKKTKSKKAPEPDLDFTKSLQQDLPDLFAPPKNPKSLLLPAKKVPCSNKLPEDCHYQPEDLVKLFLLPHVMCLGKRRQRTTDSGAWKDGNDLHASFPDWDNGSTCSGQENDGYAHSDVEEPDMLVSKPRQVNKVEVQYDKTAKQVDVHLLKETLWDHLNVSTQEPKVVHEDSISFKHILSTFPDDCRAAAPQDISPHLCFICLLHLANEHGLRIQGCTDLDDLSIHLPSSC